MILEIIADYPLIILACLAAELNDSFRSRTSTSFRGRGEISRSFRSGSDTSRAGRGGPRSSYDGGGAAAAAGPP